MTFTILGSGSRGNSTLIEHEGTRILVDCGMTCGKLVQRLAFAGAKPDDIKGILVTHEHNDHVSALDVWSKHTVTPVYGNAETLGAISGRFDGFRFINGKKFDIGPIEVESFGVSHDAINPTGFILRAGGRMLAILTDTGIVSPSIRERIAGAHAIAIEANYDPQMLADDQTRPWSIKTRTTGRYGHLSNQAAAEAVPESVEKAVLIHLSSRCNTAEKAKETFRAIRSNVRVAVATQDQLTPAFQV